jgi:hypothetical protein
MKRRMTIAGACERDEAPVEVPSLTEGDRQSTVLVPANRLRVSLSAGIVVKEDHS